MKITTKFWMGLGVLVVLSPLGLLIPEHFKAGSAWGEWGAGQIRELVGYIPKGLEKLSSLWSAPLPDYVFKGWEEKPITSVSLAYIFSAVIGGACLCRYYIAIRKILEQKRIKNGIMGPRHKDCRAGCLGYFRLNRPDLGKHDRSP